MIKVCVFSDSHGSSGGMAQAMRLEEPDICFFLGDGERDLADINEQFPQIPFYAVRGNCDLRSNLSSALTCVVGGVKIFAAHGHTLYVKQEPELETLAGAAMEAGAEIALFGHTHIQCCVNKYGITLLNPGSVGRSWRPGYAVLTIENGHYSARLKQL